MEREGGRERVREEERRRERERVREGERGRERERGREGKGEISHFYVFMYKYMYSSLCKLTPNA